MYQNRIRRSRTAAIYRAGRGLSRGARIRGAAGAAAGGFEQAFGFPSQRRWLPISNTGRAQSSENRGGDGSSEGR